MCSFDLEDGFHKVGPDDSGKGGVYKSLIDSVNKQDAPRLGYVLALTARYSPRLDGYPARIEYSPDL